jgi:hypothetical protein
VEVWDGETKELPDMGSWTLAFGEYSEDAEDYEPYLCGSNGGPRDRIPITKVFPACEWKYLYDPYKNFKGPEQGLSELEDESQMTSASFPGKMDPAMAMEKMEALMKQNLMLFDMLQKNQPV